MSIKKEVECGLPLKTNKVPSCTGGSIWMISEFDVTLQMVDEYQIQIKGVIKQGDILI